MLWDKSVLCAIVNVLSVRKRRNAESRIRKWDEIRIKFKSTLSDVFGFTNSENVAARWAGYSHNLVKRECQNLSVEPTASSVGLWPLADFCLLVSWHQRG
jgi:hypothetical protein